MANYTPTLYRKPKTWLFPYDAGICFFEGVYVLGQIHSNIQIICTVNIFPNVFQHFTVVVYQLLWGAVFKSDRDRSRPFKCPVELHKSHGVSVNLLSIEMPKPGAPWIVGACCTIIGRKSISKICLSLVSVQYYVLDFVEWLAYERGFRRLACWWERWN